MRYLIDFWDYCFYRLCNYYKRHTITNPYPVFDASTTIGVAHGFHIQCLSLFWGIITGRDVNLAYIIIFVICLMFYYDAHVYTEEKYKILARKYKGEKYKKIKGWGVFMYIILSILMFLILGILLFDYVKITIPQWIQYFSIINNPLFN